MGQMPMSVLEPEVPLEAATISPERTSPFFLDRRRVR
jgi:hypothetical protein